MKPADDRRAEGLSLLDEAAPPCPPARFNLARHCLAAAATRPDADALLVYDRLGSEPAERWSYGALAAAVGRAAGGLTAMGLGAGERALLRLGPTSRFPIAFLGVIASGGVAIPVSTQLAPREIEWIAAATTPRFACLEPDDPCAPVLAARGVRCLSGAEFDALTAAGALAEPCDRAADDPAFLVYTSGSSGGPKGVLHAHRAGFARRMMWRDWYGLGPADRLLHAGALNWTYTLGAGLMDPWAAGATAIVWQSAAPAPPDLWPRLAEAARPTIFAATPAHYRRILKYADRLEHGFATLRHGLSAGEALAPPLRAEWRARVGVDLHEALGMSEVSTFVSSSPERPAPEGAVGRPQRGRRVALLPIDPEAPASEAPVPLGAVGVVAVSRRDPGLMLGYWNDPAATAAAMRGEWFVTGDLARMDADGWLVTEGRADDQMNPQGFRVAPQEVEAAFAGVAGLLDCAAVEARLANGVGVVVLWAAAAPETERATLEGRLAAAAEAGLAAYKRPRAYLFTESLPRSATGKLARRALAASAAERLAAPDAAAKEEPTR